VEENLPFVLVPLWPDIHLTLETAHSLSWMLGRYLNCLTAA